MGVVSSVDVIGHGCFAVYDKPSTLTLNIF